jgi:hypothetical protein
MAWVDGVDEHLKRSRGDRNTLDEHHRIKAMVVVPAFWSL